MSSMSRKTKIALSAVLLLAMAIVTPFTVRYSEYSRFSEKVQSCPIGTAVVYSKTVSLDTGGYGERVRLNALLVLIGEENVLCQASSVIAEYCTRNHLDVGVSPLFEFHPLNMRLAQPPGTLAMLVEVGYSREIAWYDIQAIWE